ncbi:hypothetical protein PSTT_09710 [Puccinia striiformis]|uniref:Glycerophosphocholine acyltransferase 1 n=1 Tax=Puccinia striiformis TaxID=27350 RepID=A0A2S4V7I5_9BASI|nr:hypothetical protein PSTT_09710 [Puccinia striiformis]
MNSPSKPTDNEPRPRFSHTPDYLNNFKEDLFGDGLPFYDLLVFIDSHIDLFKRRTIDPIKVEWETRAKPLTDEWLTKAHQAIESKIKVRKSVDTSLAGKPLRAHTERELREFAERELKEFVEKIKIRRERIQTHWNDSKTVSLREKTSFFIGVQNVLITALLLAFWPELIPLSYTLQAAYYLPLNLHVSKAGLSLFLVRHLLCDQWIMFDILMGLAFECDPLPSLLWLGSWAFSNSYRHLEEFFSVHSVEKVTSLFIHIYPALVFTVIRHFYPNATERFPALKELDTISLTKTLTICSTIYIVWQTMYYKFVIIARAQRFRRRPAWRANGFMIAQYIYTIVTMLPALLWFYQSKVLSGLFLWLMFSVSVWNGASFYMEVFGRRFEKELNNLKQEIDKLNKVEADSLGLINSPAEEVVSSPLETAHEKHE